MPDAAWAVSVHPPSLSRKMGRCAGDTGSCLAQEQPGQPASGHHPGDRADYRDRNCGDSCRSERVPRRPGVCCLARGLVPRQSSTGGKARLGGISKRGDSYLRRLLVNSAHSAALFEGGQGRSLDSLPARPKTATCRCCCLSKQDGARGLGHHEQAGYLPARRSGSMIC